MVWGKSDGGEGRRVEISIGLQAELGDPRGGNGKI